MNGELFWLGAANWEIKTGNAAKTLGPFYGVRAVNNAGAFYTQADHEPTGASLLYLSYS